MFEYNKDEIYFKVLLNIKMKFWLVLSLLLYLTACGESETQSKEPVIKPTISGFYLSANYAEKLNDYELAADIYERAIDEFPNEKIFLENGYKILLIAGRVEKAVDIAKKYLKYDPESVTAKMLVAIYETKHKNYSDAQEILSSFKIKEENLSNIDSVIIPYIYAWVKVGNNNYTGAIKTLKDMLSVPALDKFTNYNLGLVYDLAGSKEEALKSYEESIEGIQPPYRYIAAAGNFFQRMGKNEQAMQLYDVFNQINYPNILFAEEVNNIKLNRKPKPIVTNAADGIVEVLSEAIGILLDNNLRRDSMAYLKMAEYLAPDSDQVHFTLGDTLEKLKDYTKSNEYYAKIGNDSDFYLQAELNYTLNLFRLGEVTKANQKFEQLIQENPEQIEFLINYADLQRESKNWQKAASLYTQAIDMIGYPQSFHWPLFYVRGICYERIKNYDSAEADLKKALELNPDEPDVLNYLAYSWLERDKNLEQAKDMLEKAHNLDPEKPHIIDSLGWAYYKLGNYERSVELLEIAVEYMPSDPVVNYHLGDAYFKLGKNLQAIYQWERSLELDDLPAEDIPIIKEKIARGL